MYYIMSEVDDSVLDADYNEPDHQKLQSIADSIGWPVYVIRGERIGATVEPTPDDQITSEVQAYS